MFSSQDIRDILQSFPLEENSKLDANGFSPLLISPQGQGFVTKDHAQREFDRIVTDAGSVTPLANAKSSLTILDSRLLPTDIARDIDIEADAVLRFAAASPGLALLGQDRTIIPKYARGMWNPS